MTQISPVVLIGSHRSGTSWCGKILEASGMLGCFEPFNMFNSPEMYRFRVAPHHTHVILGPDDEDRLLFDHAKNVFTGQYHTKWTRSRNRGSFKESECVLIKDIYLHTFLEWSLKRFEFRPCVIIRHPGGVVESMERVENHFKPNMALALERPAARAYVSKFLSDAQIQYVRDHNSTYFERALSRWLVDNRILLDVVRLHAATTGHTIPVVNYELLCDDPQGQAKKLYAGLGIRWSTSVEKFIDKSTRTDTPSPFAVTRTPSLHRDAWKEKVTAEELAKINQGLELFCLSEVVNV